MVAGFGRYFADGSDDLLGFDASDPRDAMYIAVTARLPVEAGDSSQVRTIKDRFNRAASGFEVEARIHELTLRLVRNDPTKLAHQEQLLRPRFSLDDSRISFRVQRYTENATERASLRAIGFECERATGRPGYRCWREFWTWDRLRAFVGGDGALALVLRGREELMGRAIGRVTQLVLDHSIESIQEALDQELARVVSIALDRYATARDAVAHRLHAGLRSQSD
jgi:hypothetical protein